MSNQQSDTPARQSGVAAPPAENSTAEAHALAQGALERVSLPVAGMHCASCAGRIERNLQKSQGVRKANVNFATGRATVEYDPGECGVRDAI